MPDIVSTADDIYILRVVHSVNIGPFYLGYGLTFDVDGLSLK